MYRPEERKGSVLHHIPGPRTIYTTGGSVMYRVLIVDDELPALRFV